MNRKLPTIIMIAAAGSALAINAIGFDSELVRRSSAEPPATIPAAACALKGNAFTLHGQESATPDNHLTIHRASPLNTSVLSDDVETIFEMHPSEEEFAACTVIDGNNDGFKIEHDIHYGLNGTLYDWPIYYNNRNAMPVATSDADEWIVTPPVYLDNLESLYGISIEAETMSSAMRESFQIILAESDDIESLRAGKIIMNEPAVYNEDYETFTSSFGIASPGYYRFAIHINSSVDRGWRLALRNLRVTTNDNSSKVPASCTDLELIPDENGALTATAVFTMPSTYISNTAIPADETITAQIASRIETVEVTGKPGQQIRQKVATADGTNLITVTFSNANGLGESAKGTVFCGIDVPSDPVVTASVTDDNMDLVLRWDPVTTGQNGGIVPQNGLTYNIYRYATTDEAGMWILFEEGVTECEYHVIAETYSQQLYQVMVSAANETGESTGGLSAYASAVLGTPHGLPANETFPDKTMTYDGLLIDYPDDSYTALWALDNPENIGITGGPQSALMCVVLQAGYEGKGYAELPKFSTKGCTNARVRLQTYISSATPRTEVRIHSTEGRGNGDILGVINSASGSGWTELTFEVPEKYLDRGWIVVSMDVDCSQVGHVFALGGYSIYENQPRDLAVSRISVPSYITLGDETEITAIIENRGCDPMNAPEIKGELRNNGQLLQRIEFSHDNVTLAESETTPYTAKLSFRNADFANKDLTLCVSLADSDDDNSNNEQTAEFRVGLGALPIVSDLKAAGSPESEEVTLSWTNPYARGFVDTFEDYPHGNHDYSLGNWKNIDFDGANTYVTEGFDIPDPGQPKAFQAVNTYKCGMLGMNQPSGDSFLIAFSPEGKQADDWLISPEVKGGSEVRFYITSLSGYYPETVEIMYSSTDDDLDSFTPVGSILLEDSGWGLFSGNLPADAKYFAIHYVSNDQFGICIDDIVYSPVSAPVEITGWNLYKNELLVRQDITETQAKDSAPDANALYRYNVAAVGLRKGIPMEFPLSATADYTRNPASVDFVTVDNVRLHVEGQTLIVSGCKDKSVETVSLAGIRLQSTPSAPETLSVPLSTGVYIVTVDGKAHKVIIP